MEPLLQIRNLKTRFKTGSGLVKAVNGINLDVRPGELVGIVGESGCGKSVSMLSTLRLLNKNTALVSADSILYKGKDILNIRDEQMRRLRGKEISMIFQDPMTSLNPVMRIGRQITESLEIHTALRGGAATERAEELLKMVGIPNPRQRLNGYSYQLSGGMRQRVMIAIALACDPSLLIADEPTTALDVTIQAQIVDLVKDLHAQREMAVIWITHDLSLLARIAQRVVVMYSGYIVEDAPIIELFDHTSHPYTYGIMRALPSMKQRENEPLYSIPGQPPNLEALPEGCPFAARCALASEQCKKQMPPLEETSAGHFVACWHTEEVRRMKKDER